MYNIAKKNDIFAMPSVKQTVGTDRCENYTRLSQLTNVYEYLSWVANVCHSQFTLNI